MAKHKLQRDACVMILKFLLLSERPLTTTELVNLTGCDRKTVYANIDKLETIGFPIIKSKAGVPYGWQEQNAYLWDGRIMGGIGQ